MVSIPRAIIVLTFLGLIVYFFLGSAQQTRRTDSEHHGVSVNCSIKTFKRKYLSSRLASRSQLGNHLFELSSLVGIARTLNRTPVVFIQDWTYKRDLEYTNISFPGLIDQFLVINSTVPSTIRDTVFHDRCCIYQNPKVLLNIEDEHIHLTGTFYQSYKYFKEMRNEQLGWLRKPTEEIHGLPKSDGSTHVTCVHTRRGDFIDVGFQPSDDHFIRKAVRYIQKEENPKQNRKVVVVFGDDREFMQSIFKDTVLSSDEIEKKSTNIHFVSQNSPSDDILYSRSNCEVVLISAPHSTFGWWMGYVSKNYKVYHMDMRVHYVGALKGGRMNIKDYYPPNWIPLKFAADNKTIVIGDK
ncbi:unnamed protein product [Caenorhabditis brenneri]